ncbi:MAG: hypothetical protein H0U76_06615 [Ktedonobacteraceae bacterium]|nr:hypothetical protein [Ktedonobacteraceae bacterium]
MFACFKLVAHHVGQATDEQVLDQAKRRVNTRKVGGGWNIIPMDQDIYSSITDETASVMTFVRHFLEEPGGYIEEKFLEKDPVYQAYLDAPYDRRQEDE